MVTQRKRRHVYPMLFMAVFHVNTRLPWAHVEIPFFFFLNTICKIYSKDESSGITFCSQNIHAHSVLDCHLKLSQKKSPPTTLYCLSFTLSTFKWCIFVRGAIFKRGKIANFQERVVLNNFSILSSTRTHAVHPLAVLGFEIHGIEIQWSPHRREALNYLSL